MNPFYQIIATTFTSFIICFFAIPSIIKIAELKNLFDEPDDRKRHSKSVPTLGGIAIFAGAIFSITFWANQGQIVELQYIIASLLILFFVGIKDDIVNLVAHKKLLGQIIAACIIVFFADIRLTSLYGILGIYHLSYTPSCIISLLAVIGITNSFNLIDGIDTLAGSVGLLSTLLFGSWFFLAEHHQYAIMAFSLAGALLAFLYFNRTPAKVFMGDTGSLLVGLICSIMAIKFVEFNRDYIGPKQYQIFSVPAVAISVLIIPLFDTLRVMVIRLLNKKSPLSPDRNHIHHILVDLGLSHHKSVLILISLNFLLVVLAYQLQHITGEILLGILLILMGGFTAFLSFKRKRLT